MNPDIPTWAQRRPFNIWWVFCDIEAIGVKYCDINDNGADDDNDDNDDFDDDDNDNGVGDDYGGGDNCDDNGDDDDDDIYDNEDDDDGFFTASIFIFQLHLWKTLEKDVMEILF